MAEKKQSAPSAPKKITKVKKPKKQKVKQGHKLVWFTLALMCLPLVIIGYVLLTSMGEGGRPVFGSRFGASDLMPRIAQSDLDAIQSDLLQISGLESATINMNAATVRVHLNLNDGINQDQALEAAENAYQIVNNHLPIDVYFTNTPEGKNYDVEIDSYNYLIDDEHPFEGQVYVKITKTGAGGKIVDFMSQPKDQQLVDDIYANNNPQPEQPVEEQPQDETQYYGDGQGYYDEYGNYYTDYGYYDANGNFYYY